ncbi:cell filamentation protein Fic [Flavobacterium faecale]|uniref:Cell filamentation protein Fic n=1 Tax=Flavobacterium faecale TaxID=1355330 RepID=A0A2S1LGH9_9FLAO|nr:virulence RhuM family protein [Flavobacterium faecale]AWG22865.1 cell filamentation protein Fic [Flavobacterium faecale]
MESQILLYQTEDGETKIQTRLENETVWLTQAQMAELFGKDRTVITKHISNIFSENELDEKSNVQNLHIANSDKPVKFYNLDVIISVGYRVKSLQGTKFRQWATARLREYIVKGFTMNDDMLKQTGGGNYFEELLARIRDIRSSEKVFWRKVLDIYASSIDYDPKAESSILFFQTIQNKMHWAAHGRTAAEIIYKRIDASKTNLGLTSFKGNKPNKQETEIAKNYLNEEELNILNRIVTAYLDIAELQALNQKPMYMTNWIEKLDEFIQLTGNQILLHSGTISHKQAIEKANGEYEKYKLQTRDGLSQVEKHFIENLEKVNKIIKPKN